MTYQRLPFTCEISLCRGGTTDHESVATYFRYRIHFRRLTQDVKPFLALYSAGKSTA